MSGRFSLNNVYDVAHKVVLTALFGLTVWSFSMVGSGGYHLYKNYPKVIELNKAKKAAAEEAARLAMIENNESDDDDEE